MNYNTDAMLYAAHDNRQFTMYVDAYLPDLLAFVLWIKWRLELEDLQEHVNLRGVCRKVEQRHPHMPAMTMKELFEVSESTTLRRLLDDDEVSEMAPLVNGVTPLQDLI